MNKSTKDRNNNNEKLSIPIFFKPLIIKNEKNNKKSIILNKESYNRNKLQRIHKK